MPKKKQDNLNKVKLRRLKRKMRRITNIARGLSGRETYSGIETISIGIDDK